MILSVLACESSQWLTHKSAETKEANGKQMCAQIQLGSPAGKMGDGSLWRQVCVDAQRARKRISNGKICGEYCLCTLRFPPLPLQWPESRHYPSFNVPSF